MTDWLPAFQIIFLSLFLQGLPFLLIGSFLGAFIVNFVPLRRLTSHLPQSTLGGILLGSLAGLVIPACECVGVPLVRRLLRNGLPPTTAIAYLLASPVINPVCLISTWIAFQYDNPWCAVLVRTAGSLLIAIVSALILSRLPVAKIFRPEVIVSNDAYATTGLWEHPPAAWLASRYPRLASWLANACMDMLTVCGYYLFGCLLAAIVQTLLPPYAAPTAHPALVIPGFMGLSVIASLCTSADAFVAKSFAGFPLAALFAFLWLGAVLDLKLIFVYQTIFRRRTVLLLAVILVVTVLILSLIAAHIPLEHLFYGQSLEAKT